MRTMVVVVISQLGDVLVTDMLGKGICIPIVGRVASGFGSGRYIAVGIWSSRR